MVCEAKAQLVLLLACKILPIWWHFNLFVPGCKSASGHSML